MILTEINKFSDKELKFFEYWNSCEWLYLEKYPSSIFLLKYIKQSEVKHCVFEVDWKRKQINLNNYSYHLENFFRFDLHVEMSSEEVNNLISNLKDYLLNQDCLKPKNKKMIEKIIAIEKNKKSKKTKDNFNVNVVTASRKLCDVEEFINGTDYF